ncbi:putative mitochondrial protein [Cucumis melo var. makuwa]|uniref:Mitochondrial protein n=1 Tax=Cucumis melo var. makuwa TaxID=1194695 RepID=A0A5A7VD76_CUCMM|nr:putative mitochondrial protein [Cucumis melo var. makuwa]TYK15176.1 putative mitochondrial protein [Cucumis melo var. makuwa]
MVPTVARDMVEVVAVSQLVSPFAAANTVVNPNWYIDSGATNHVTADYSNLSNPSDYSDNNAYVEFHGCYCFIKDKATGQTPLNSILKDGQDAIATPQWKQAMDDKYNALVKAQTWSLVLPTSSQNLIGSKWVFRPKQHPDGSIHRYKARLVAKGFHQNPRVDFFETFSPIIMASTIRVILSVAISKGWSLRQLDFNNTFLNGKLDEMVFMTQPPGLFFVHFSVPRLCD